MKIRDLYKETLTNENPAGAVAGAAKQAIQKTATGAKQAASKIGGGKGSGAMMAKGLDKIAQGGALTGNLSKQIAPFAKQLSTILADQTLRNRFMQLIKTAEKSAGKQAQPQAGQAQPQAGQAKPQAGQAKPQAGQAQPQMQTQSIDEVATAGATSAGAIATVANPAHAYGDIPRDKNGIPKKKSKKKSDGTVVNALDANDSFFGGKIAKR
jgi:hypothetical protein